MKRCLALALVACLISCGKKSEPAQNAGPSSPASTGAADVPKVEIKCTVKEGGALQLSNGASIAIPPGALLQDDTVSMQGFAQTDLDLKGYRPIGPRYEMTVGQSKHYVFRSAVQMKLPYDAAWLGKVSENRLRVAVNAGGSWSLETGAQVDSKTHRVTLGMSHFSGAQLVQKTRAEGNLNEDAQAGSEMFQAWIAGPHPGGSYTGLPSPHVSLMYVREPIRIKIEYLNQKQTHFMLFTPKDIGIELLGLSPEALNIIDTLAPIALGANTIRVTVLSENAGTVFPLLDDMYGTPIQGDISFTALAYPIQDQLTANDKRLEETRAAMTSYFKEGFPSILAGIRSSLHDEARQANPAAERIERCAADLLRSIETSTKNVSSEIKTAAKALGAAVHLPDGDLVFNPKLPDDVAGPAGNLVAIGQAQDKAAKENRFNDEEFDVRYSAATLQNALRSYASEQVRDKMTLVVKAFSEWLDRAKWVDPNQIPRKKIGEIPVREADDLKKEYDSTRIVDALKRLDEACFAAQLQEAAVERRKFNSEVWRGQLQEQALDWAGATSTYKQAYQSGREQYQRWGPRWLLLDGHESNLFGYRYFLQTNVEPDQDGFHYVLSYLMRLSFRFGRIDEGESFLKQMKTSKGNLASYYDELAGAWSLVNDPAKAQAAQDKAASLRK